MKGLAKRMALLSEEMIGIRRATVRDLRAGKSFIVTQCRILYLRESRQMGCRLIRAKLALD